MIDLFFYKGKYNPRTPTRANPRKHGIFHKIEWALRRHSYIYFPFTVIKEEKIYLSALRQILQGFNNVNCRSSASENSQSTPSSLAGSSTPLDIVVGGENNPLK
jgi:hypothetical protein